MIRAQVLAATVAGKPLFWIAFIVAMFSWPILRSLHAERHLRPARAVLGGIRDFTLRDHDGTDLGASELRGRIWLASFTTIAQATTHAQSRRTMLKLDEVRHRTRNLGDTFRLLTFPLDPDRDTAERMLALAVAHRASHGSWRFVSGPVARVREVLLDFKISETTPQSRVALVDGNMSIRGYYDLARDDAVPLLLRDVSRLLSPRPE